MPEAYYRSTAPEIAAYWADYQRLRADFLERVKALEAEFPGSLLQWRQGRCWELPVGLKQSEHPGAGWLKKSGEDYYTPDMRTKAGNALAARLRAAMARYPLVPGMPDMVVSGTRSYWHGLEEFGAETWARWRCGPDAVEGERGFNPSLWQRAKASEYYLAKEAHEAASGKDEDDASND